MTLLETAGALAMQPRKAFDAIADRPRATWPLIWLLAGTVVATVWYYYKVDIAWLMDQTMSGNALIGGMSEERRAMATKLLTRNSLMLAAVFAGTAAYVAITLTEAVYYLLAGNITNVQRSFAQWFGLTVWTSLPQLISAAASLLLLASYTGSKLEPGVLGPLSLNELFFHRTVSDPHYQLLSSWNLPQLWSLALAMVGVHCWSQRSWLYSTVLVLLPRLVVTSAWYVVSLS